MSYYNLGSTYRSQSAPDTLSGISPIFEKIGITRVAHITGLDHLAVPVSTCIRPTSKHLSVSQGKGLTQELSDISAIMEAVEAFHMENPPATAIKAKYCDLKSDHCAISPNQFNSGHFTSNLETLNIDWIYAHNLSTNKQVLIPRVLSSLDTTQFHPEYGFLSVSTNGIAAGNCIDEALCHALYEVIERDALYQWKSLASEEREKQRIGTESIHDKINSNLIKKIKQADLNLKVWDITSSLQIPTFHCALYDKNVTKSINLFTGTGTHLSKTVALSRAITETLQARLTLISGNRDDIFPNYYLAQKNKIHKIDEENISVKSYDECRQPYFTHSFNKNAKQLVSSISNNGYKTILVIDHTKPEIKIPVTQVIIPDMQFDGRRM